MSYVTNQWRRCVPTRSLGRLGRLATTLSVLSAFVLSQLTAQAILIHEHHGHEIHAHAIGIDEVENVIGNPEHRHEEHEHDCTAVEYSDNEESSLVILLDLPEGLARGRLASGDGTLVTSGASGLPTNTLAFVTPQSDPPFDARPSGPAPALRACGPLQGILLTSHALLL